MPTTENMRSLEVALLTGGGDKPYVYGLVKALMSQATALEVVGSDELDCPEFRNAIDVRFLNFRGSQQHDTCLVAKALRVFKYYCRLIAYTAIAPPKLFHILWNNKFDYFDRTLLMLWYRLLGKTILLTLHNVNGAKRDGSDSLLNRLTLEIQYRLADHLFVHTEKMKQELVEEFGAAGEKVTVIPFGINNAVPDTPITGKGARQRLGITDQMKVILFFGNIAPYKGLEYLVAVFHQITRKHDEYKLVIAGRPKNCEEYWHSIRDDIADEVVKGNILLRDKFIPDEETELYMKAADVLILPYRHIYQSGVLFLGYSFGLPVLAADVGSLRDEIVEGKTGFVFRPEDPEDLARAIDRYFSSDLFVNLDIRRREIKEYAEARNSWDIVGRMTVDVYSSLMHRAFQKAGTESDISTAVDASMNDRISD